jgi:1,4-alpha-glucan branching enzyme
MTPVVRYHWKVEVFNKPNWKEIFNSDAIGYYGTGDVYNPDIQVKVLDEEINKFELDIHLPALGAIILK